jgi:hypothetical protein
MGDVKREHTIGGNAKSVLWSSSSVRSSQPAHMNMCAARHVHQSVVVLQGHYCESTGRALPLAARHLTLLCTRLLGISGAVQAGRSSQSE